MSTVSAPPIAGLARPAPRTLERLTPRTAVASDPRNIVETLPIHAVPLPQGPRTFPVCRTVLDWLPHGQHRRQPHPLVARTDRGRSGSGKDRSMLRQCGSLPKPPAVYTKDEPEGTPGAHVYSHQSRPGHFAPTRRPWQDHQPEIDPRRARSDVDALEISASIPDLSTLGSVVAVAVTEAISTVQALAHAREGRVHVAGGSTTACNWSGCSCQDRDGQQSSSRRRVCHWLPCQDRGQLSANNRPPVSFRRSRTETQSTGSPSSLGMQLALGRIAGSDRERPRERRHERNR